MTVTADEILRAARAHAAPLTGETAGYLVLGAVDALGDAEGRVSPVSVSLLEDGSVRVGRLDAGSSGDLEGDLRGLLSALLALSPPGVPALVRVARPSGPRGVGHLVSELEAALIPVNRAAARRALARLCRDVQRARASGKLAVASPEAERGTPKAGAAAAAPSFTADPAAALAAGPDATPVVSLTEPVAPASMGVVAEVASPGAEGGAAEDAMSLPVGPEVNEPPAARWEAPALARFEETRVGPDRTPFLGGWPGAAPVVTAPKPASPSFAVPAPVTPPALELPAAVDPLDHDTDHVPDVVFDDELASPALAAGATPVVPEVPAPLAPPVAPPVAVATAAAATTQALVALEEETAWMSALFDSPVAAEPPVDPSDAVTPEAWASAELAMQDAPLAFGSLSAEELTRPPPVAARAGVAEVVREEPAASPPAVEPRAPLRVAFAEVPSVELTAPWPPVAPAVLEDVGDALEESQLTVDLEDVEPIDEDEVQDDLANDSVPPSAELASMAFHDEAGDEVGMDVAMLAVRVADEDPAFEGDQVSPGAPSVADEDPAFEGDQVSPGAPSVAVEEAHVSAAGEKEAAAIAVSEREASFLVAHADHHAAAEDLGEPLPEVEGAPVDAGAAPEEASSGPEQVGPPSGFATVKPEPAPYRPRRSDVQALLDGFGEDGDASLAEVSRELQRFAGIGGTPDPGAVAPKPRATSRR